MNESFVYRLSEIILDLRTVRKNNNLIVSDETLFSEACSCWRGEQASKRFEQKTTNKKEEYQKDNLASKAQIDYLCKHNLDHNAENINKSEAFKIIKKHKEEVNKKKIG